jgi:predicted phosphodiesterase
LNVNPKTLVIGDCHIEVDQNLTRFELLESVMREHLPETVVLMGDFLTLESLSAWDKNKRKLMEGRRYWEEIDRAFIALNIIGQCIGTVTNKQRRSKKKGFSPNLVYLMGNHEDRLRRYFEQNPTFDDDVQLSIAGNLELYTRGYTVIPYGEHYQEHGVNYTHIPINGADRPVSGMGICRKALQLYGSSVVFGHTHKKAYEAAKFNEQDGVRMAYNCGCFFEGHEEYRLQPQSSPTWRGVSILEHYADGLFDIHEYSLDRMKQHGSS